MPLQNFKGNPSTLQPDVSAPWLNQVDQFVNNLFKAATTPAQALAALGLSNGGSSSTVTVATLTALRSVASAAQQYAVVTGYYASGDGGGGIYAFVSTDTTSADNGGTVIVGTDGGRWHYAMFTGSVPAKVFGVKADGTTDDHAAYQAAINWLAAIGGGNVLMPVGTSCLSTGLTINNSGVSIIGAGRGGLHDAGALYTAPSVFKWTGGSGGTMITLTPPSTSGAPGLRGCSVDGMLLDGNSLLAGVGLSVVSCVDSVHRITGCNFSGSVIQYTSLLSVGEYPDCQGNDIWVSAYQESASSGAVFKCSGTSTGSANFSLNRIHQIRADHYNTAVILGDSDTNTFYQISLYRIPGSSAPGIRLKGSALNPDWGNCRWNTFINVVAGTGGLYVEGTADTTYPSIGNNILVYDDTNGEPEPVLGAGGTLWWGHESTSIGYRNQFIPGTNYNQIRYMDGRIAYSGSISLGSGGSSTITFPLGYGTAVTRASACYAGSGNVPAYVAPTTTGITVYNPSSGTQTVWWSSEGF